MSNTSELGRAAEQAACQFLEHQGLVLLEKNYRCRYGEIDLIMQHGNALVFIEVRYRSNTRYGSGSETINYQKQQKLIATASHYLQKHKQSANQHCRFDVISLTASNEKKIDMAKIQWISNAFVDSY